MEKANIVTVHKKGVKQCLKNYRRVSLLPICGKILERLIFNEIIRFLIENNLKLNAKLFADDTSLFSVIHDVDTSANELNNDLYQINKWAFQWNMSFNPDPSKQAQ